MADHLRGDCADCRRSLGLALRESRRVWSAAVAPWTPHQTDDLHTIPLESPVVTLNLVRSGNSLQSQSGLIQGGAGRRFAECPDRTSCMQADEGGPVLLRDGAVTSPVTHRPGADPHRPGADRCKPLQIGACRRRSVPVTALRSMRPEHEVGARGRRRPDPSWRAACRSGNTSGNTNGVYSGDGHWRH